MILHWWQSSLFSLFSSQKYCLFLSKKLKLKTDSAASCKGYLNILVHIWHGYVALYPRRLQSSSITKSEKFLKFVLKLNFKWLFDYLTASTRNILRVLCCWNKNQQFIFSDYFTATRNHQPSLLWKSSGQVSHCIRYPATHFSYRPSFTPTTLIFVILRA
jgi:hypothetical protein